MKTLSLTTVIAFVVCTLACGNAPTNTGASNVAAVSTPKPTVTNAAPGAVEFASGRALYSQNCAACHKEDGTGGKMTIEGKTLNPDNLTSEKIKKFTDEKIAGYIMNGVEDEGMPAFRDKLAEAQIREIVTYVRKGLQKVDASPSN